MALGIASAVAFLAQPSVWGTLMAYMGVSKGLDIYSQQKVRGGQISLEEKKLNAMIKAMTNKQEVQERMYGEMKDERGEQRNYLAAMREGDRGHELGMMMLKNMMQGREQNTAMQQSMIGNMSRPSQRTYPQRSTPYAQLTQL